LPSTRGKEGNGKSRLPKGCPNSLGRKPERDAAAGAEHEQRLYAKIGELQTELDWLKKKLGLRH
jgi:hypothetical protein